MVSVNLYGRMCNQAFQIACCVAYALRHGLEYHIPVHTLNDNVWKPMFTHLENPKWKPMTVCYTKEQLDTDGRLEVVLREKTHSYEELPFREEWRNEKINIIIDGYRQSLKYFEDYLPEVRKAFGFDYTVKNKGYVAIHYRLGDYRLYPTRHPIITSEYLVSAIDKINELTGRRWKYIIYSDEIDWCKENLMGEGKIFDNVLHQDTVFFSEGKNELEDFQSMLECEHFILSASTYGLMASILSESKNKICVAPKLWFEFENFHLDTSTICPENYIRI